MPDILFHGGPIYTLDDRQPRAEAVLVRDDRIVAVGSAAEVRAETRSGYEDVALAGRTLLPGLTDAHIHLLWTGLLRQSVDLEGVGSLQAALDRIRDRSARLVGDEWLGGHGWNHALWDYRWPTAADLDRVSGDRPAALSRKDGHSLWVNTRALQLAGIDRATPDPDGGEIQRDERGEPTGILLENAMRLVDDVMPEPADQQKQAALRDIIAACNARGITSLHLPEGPDALAALQVLYGAGQLNARILYNPPVRQLNEYVALGIRSGFGNEWIRIGGVKIFSDGSLGSQSCSMLLPFEGTTNVGIPTIPDDELFAAVRTANTNGLAVMIHAIGDRANRTVLDAIEEAAVPGSQRPLLPNRLEHAQHLDPADVPRFAALGVVASMQPIHATSDWETAERLLGAQRSAWSYAWRPLHESGAVLAFGSDAPVETFDPWAGIHAAVTRQRSDGSPPNGWHPELALNVHQALWAYVIGPAITSGETAIKGRLAPGMLADLVVTDSDPFAVAPDDLPRIEVAHTFVGGRSVFERS